VCLNLIAIVENLAAQNAFFNKLSILEMRPLLMSLQIVASIETLLTISSIATKHFELVSDISVREKNWIVPFIFF